MKRPSGRLQAESGRMVRTAVSVFAVAWLTVFLVRGLAQQVEDVRVALFLLVPAGVVNLVAVALLVGAYSRAWAVRPEDPATPGRVRWRLIAGTWTLVASLVLYAGGVVLSFMEDMF